MLRCTGNVEVYTRSTDIYWTPSASAGRTTHLYSWEPTVWNHVRNRELPCYRRRAKSWPSYTAAVMALHRDITSTRNRDTLFLAPSPKKKLSMTFLVARSCSRTYFGRILFWFVDPCCFHVAWRRICYLCSCSDRMLRKYFSSLNYTNKNIISFKISPMRNMLQKYFAVT